MTPPPPNYRCRLWASQNYKFKFLRNFLTKQNKFVAPLLLFLALKPIKMVKIGFRIPSFGVGCFVRPGEQNKKGRKKPICLLFHIILQRIFRSRKKHKGNSLLILWFIIFQAKKAKGISMTYPKTASLVCKPNTMRQRNGFPPNFVHSLDSSHMMLTSLYLWSQGNIDSVPTYMLKYIF